MKTKNKEKTENAVEKEIKKITDFKNDVLFKFTFGDDSEISNDLLKRMIEGIIKIKVESLRILNPHLIADQVEDKDMVLDIRVVTDQGEQIDIEMQNAKFSIEDGIRFWVYGCSMIADQARKGEEYTPVIKPVYQIIFINDVYELSPYLFDAYSSHNDHGTMEFVNMGTRIYVQIPLINTYVECKSLEEFNDVEKMIYIIANGLTNDIIESEVGKKMKDKMEEFNEDRELKLTAYNRIMKKAAQEKRHLNYLI